MAIMRMAEMAVVMMMLVAAHLERRPIVLQTNAHRFDNGGFGCV